MNGKLFPKMTQEKGVKIMPKVGDKHFAYTPEGKQAAKDYAMETGEQAIPTYDAGGRVQNIKGYGDAPVGPSMLPEPNGAMTDEEAVKYLNPQATAKEGGKINKEEEKAILKGDKKTYEEKGKTLSPIKIEGQKGSVVTRRDLKEAVAEREHKKILSDYKKAKKHAEEIKKKLAKKKSGR